MSINEIYSSLLTYKVRLESSQSNASNNPKKGNVIMMVGTITLKGIRMATLGTKVKVEIWIKINGGRGGSRLVREAIQGQSFGRGN